MGGVLWGGGGRWGGRGGGGGVAAAGCRQQHVQPAQCGLSILPIPSSFLFSCRSTDPVEGVSSTELGMSQQD